MLDLRVKNHYSIYYSDLLLRKLKNFNNIALNEVSGFQFEIEAFKEGNQSNINWFEKVVLRILKYYIG